MNNKQLIQEQKCLLVERMIDLLRIKLSEIEHFRHYKAWDSTLKSLKKQIDEIYWNN